MIEGDCALEAARIDGERVVGDLRRGVEDVEEIRRASAPAGTGCSRSRRPAPACAISMVARFMKVTISPTLARPLRLQPDAEQEDGQKGQRRRSARRDGGDRPPGQDRHLRVEHRPSMICCSARLRVSMRVKLWITETLPSTSETCSASELLCRSTVCCSDSVRRRTISGEQRRRRRPARSARRRAASSRQRQRQQDQKGRKRGAILAEEGQPQAGHAVGAFEHDFQKPPGMGRRRGSSTEDASTCSKNCAITASRRRCARRSACSATMTADGNREQARSRPSAASRGARSQQLQRPARRLRAAQFVDDASEQHRLGELRARQSEIGQRQKDRDALLAAEQAKHAYIDG